jgi:glycosyltransferase involved in cell wall biosynthesis
MLPPAAMITPHKTILPPAILQVLPRLDYGGAERVVVEIAEAVNAAGHRSFITAENGHLAAAALRAGAELLPLPLATKNPLKIWSNTRKLVNLVEQNGISLIHAHSRAPAWSAYRAAQRCGIPFVTTYHGSYSENTKIKHRYNQVMAQGDRVIAVSHYIAELIKTRYATPAERVRVVHGGVDTSIFDPDAVRGDRAVRLARAWRADFGHPAIMLPGRLTGWKGQKLFIKALAVMRHKDALGILVGSDQGRDSYTANLIALAESLGVVDRLRIVGHADDMPAALMLADIVVNCSTSPEAFGRTVIEAQAMGRVVVAADHGGARETIVNGTSGLLVQPNSSSALADMLDSVLDQDVAQRIKFGAQARAHIEQNFSLKMMQDKMLDIYAELLG